MTAKSAEVLKKDLIDALTRELEVARKQSSGDRTHELRNGVFSRKKANNFVYEFEELTGIPPDEGAQVTFSVGAESVKGRYLGEYNEKFGFELEKNIGDFIEKTVAISDPLFLLERQIELLKEENPYKNILSLSSLGIVSFPQTEIHILDTNFVNGLNSLQASSLDVVSRNPVTYIWGPPGTGKTTTMGSIVSALANAGLRTLLVSNTNLALDTALERCLDRTAEKSELLPGAMLRIGTMVKPELIDKYSDAIDLDLRVEIESAPLRKLLEEKSSALQKAKNITSDLKEKYEEFQDYERSTMAVVRLEEQITSFNKAQETKKSEILKIQSSMNALQHVLSTAESKSGLSRLLSRTPNPVKLRYEISELIKKKEALENELISQDKVFRTLESNLNAAKDKSKKSGKWLKENAIRSKYPEKIAFNESEISVFTEEIKVLQDQIAKKREEILGRARVIACTAYKPLIDKEIVAMNFDCVVVDEASMLPLPLYYSVAFLAQKRLVIAGDFRQLPPIVRIGDNRSPDNLDNRLREILTSNPFVYSDVINRAPKQLVALRDQYRMRSEISDLISSTFYPEHTLKTVAHKDDLSTPWGNESFIIIDTKSLDSDSAQVNGKSRRNVLHALVVEELVSKLLENGWSFESTAKKSFGVISPYAKQSSFIEGILRTKIGKPLNGAISTVHRFQGNERDLMIIDVTKVATNAEPNLGAFLGNSDPLSPSNAMWNVAISRARQHVILVTDLETLKKNPSAVISQLAQKMLETAKIVDASELVSESAIERTKTKAKTGSISWFTGSGFYDAFEKDLKKAKSKIFISSPFTAFEATSRWLPIFRDLRANDVEIYGYTKPIDEKSNQDVSKNIHTELQQIFKELKFIPRMHEKIAVIDDKIVWAGSLNILSHATATEIMMRLENEDFAQSIINEYLMTRRSTAVRRHDTSNAKSGDKCPVPGCSGTMRLVPGGFSNRTGKSYNSFIGCDNFKQHDSLKL